MASANRLDRGGPFRRPYFWAAFAGVLALAAALRFWDLARAPLWMDEAFTVLIARLPVRALLFEQVDVHPPLAYLVEKLWIALGAHDLALARAPAALFGVLGVGALTLSVSDLVSRRAGLLAGLFLALSTGHVYFSQDARMYPLLTFGLALAAWGAVGGLGRPEGGEGAAPALGRRGYAALYLLGAVTAVYSHIAGLVFLAALNLGCLAARYLLPPHVSSRPYLRYWLATNLILLVLALPWLSQIPGSSGGFAGLGEAPLTTAPWFLRNAVGLGGLPSLIRKPAEAALFLVMARGASLAWRRGRRAYALVGLAVMVLYPLAVIGLSLASPILANRIFLPLGLIVAGFIGCALDRAWEFRPAGPAVAVAALTVMGLSTLLEHAARTKYENLPAALAFAREKGLGAAPVLTCGFLTAGSVWAAEPRRSVYMVDGPNAMRFDPGFMTALRLSLTRVVNGSSEEVDRYLGGGYLSPLGEAMRGRPGAVVIVQPCPGDFAAVLRQHLVALGFAPLERRAFPGGRNGEVVMQHGETVADLYAAPR